MMELSEWARDLLMSRGALVESEGDGALRALLPAEVSARLAVGDWLSLDFGARVGADDSSEWQERLSTLLPPSPAFLPSKPTSRREPARDRANRQWDAQIRVTGHSCCTADVGCSGHRRRT